MSQENVEIVRRAYERAATNAQPGVTSKASLISSPNDGVAKDAGARIISRLLHQRTCARRPHTLAPDYEEAYCRVAR